MMVPAGSTWGVCGVERYIRVAFGMIDEKHATDQAQVSFDISDNLKIAPGQQPVGRVLLFTR